MRFSASVIAALAFTLEVGAVMAQTSAPTLPSDQQIKEAMQKNKQGLIDQGLVDQAGKPSRVQPIPAGALKAEVFTPPKPTAPIKKDDLGELVKRYQAGSSAGVPAELAKKGDVIIFASFSMPKQALKELSRQAGEMGAVVVLRGLKDASVDKTRTAAEEVNPTSAGWEVHPELFKTFKVTKVPTFVVANALSGNLLDDGCAPEATYASVSGDISLNAALETIRRRAQPGIAKLAGEKLDEFKKKNEQKRLVR